MTDKELYELWYKDPVSCCRDGAELFELTELLSGENPKYHLCDWVDKKVNRHIADWLRCLADHVDTGNAPWIYSCDIPTRSPDKPAAGVTTEDFSITFSHPWGS